MSELHDTTQDATTSASAPESIKPPVGPYRAICIDLDGTLLPLDIDEFMQRYFQALESVVVEHGIDQTSFMAGLHEGIRAMATHDDGSPNEEAFWSHFFTYVDEGACDWRGVFEKFYDGPFGEIGADVVPNPAAARAVGALVEKGYPLVLATMPMFPPRAVEWRLAWAGVDPNSFKRITTFDNSTSVKPKSAYFAENLAALGVAGGDVLMVGNNTLEDLSFANLGADTFLVTDYLLNPIALDVDATRHGSLADFADWAEALPPCASPVTEVNPGLVDPEDREVALVVAERAVMAAEAAAEHAEA